MKTIALAAAAALAALTGVTAASPAAAQDRVVTRTVVHHDGPRRAWHTRKVCRVHYRHHQRVRVCRTVRSR